MNYFFQSSLVYSNKSDYLSCSTISKYFFPIFILLGISSCAYNDPKPKAQLRLVRTHNSALREIKVQTNQKSQITIYYESPEWKRVGHAIDRVIQAADARVREFITPQPGLNLEIVLLNRHKFSENVTDATWVTAAYHKGRIFIPIDPKSLPKAKDLGNTLAHEYAHAVLDNLTKGKVPAWLDEGFALTVENQPLPSSKARFHDWIKTHKLFPISKLQSGFTHFHRDDATLAYVQSLYMVGFLLKNYDTAQLQQFCINLAEGFEEEEAFNKAYQLTTETFLANLNQQLKNIITNKKL